MTRVLFLTTGNALRAQMAEAIFRSIATGDFEVRAASTHAQTAGRLSRVVLAESGVRVDPQPPMTLEQAAAEHWDIVVTVATEAEMPSAPVTARWEQRWAVADPLAMPGYSSRVAALRSTRDAIRSHVQALLASLHQAAA